MGGGTSKDVVEENLKIGPKEFHVNGLHKGDVVIVRGETFAGGQKMFQINFKQGESTAFHFKVVFLEADGLFNKVKMNSWLDGKWGESVRKENVIYLNHHFEIKFTCLEDKFSVEIDGAHFYDYKHRVSAGKIDKIRLDGDSVWGKIEVPNQAPSSVQHYGPVEYPTPEEIQYFIKGLRSTPPALRAETGEEEGEQLAKLIKEGLEVTKKLLGDDKGVWANITKIGGYLQKISSAGSAAFAFLQFIQGIGKDSDMTVIRKALEEMCRDLKSIDKNIQDGFAKLTEHMDFIEFRKEVQNPVIAMFDLYIRCQTVKGSIPIQDFKALCSDQKNSPRAILSRMFGFLVSDDNIIASHLKAKKYIYSVWEGWSEVLFDYASQLMTMNMFYYGLICAQNEAEGNDDILIDKEDEIKDLIEHMTRMHTRLQQIEESRLKAFHTGGHAKTFLREKFKGVKFDRGSNLKRFPPETLGRIAFEMKRRWVGFNGPSDCYIMAVRGNSSGKSVDYRGARWQVFDSSKVTVVENIGGFDDNNDDVCLVLIQPVTDEMRKNNAEVRKEQKDAIKKAIDKDDYDIEGQTKAMEKLMKNIKSLPIKPLLVMYSTDYGFNKNSEAAPDRAQIKAFNYEMTSEAWSSYGGPLPWKYYWGYHFATKNYFHMAQVIVQ